MENKKQKSNRVMHLKESNHLLADYLYAQGIDIYKKNHVELRNFKKQIADSKAKIDSILQERFGTSFAQLDERSSGKLQNIRESIMNGEKLKKWVPLSQLVGYAQVLVSNAYMQLNTEIDNDIIQIAGIDFVFPFPLEHLRIQILNAFKKTNQGVSWSEISNEIDGYLASIGITGNDDSLLKWKNTFEQINHPLQGLYTEHLGTMQINQAIIDLQFREIKRSQIIQDLVGAKNSNWKPADLSNDIYAQSSEVNRSVIELVCNGIDANTGKESRVEVSMDKHGYSVRDHGLGMNPYIILEKLMIPKISGKTGKETIGRFGVGFYTALSHLKKESDFVRIETHDGTTGHIIEFRIHEGTGDIFVNTERNDNLQKGTCVSVKTEDFDSTDAERLCRELLSYNRKSAIILNGEQINENKGLLDLVGETANISYLPEISNKSDVHLLVNGVVVESFKVEGENLSKEVVLDFPLTCSIPENRSVLSINSVAIDSIKEMINMVFGEGTNDQNRVLIANTLCPVLEQLQTRAHGNKLCDNLSTFLHEVFANSVDIKSQIFLPNAACFQVLDIPNAIYLDSRIYSVNLDTVPGIIKCDRFKSSQGYRLFIAKFKEGSDQFIIEDDKNLVIDSEIYERNRDNPAALNLYFGSLDHTGQNKRESEKMMKGSIALQGDIHANEKHEPRTDEISREMIEKIGIFDSGNRMSIDEVYNFVNLSDSEQIAIIEKRIFEGIEIFDYSTVETFDPLPCNTETKDNILKILRETTLYNFDSIFEKIQEVESQQNVRIKTGAYYHLLTLYKYSKLIRKNPKLVKILCDWKKFSEGKSRDYSGIFFGVGGQHTYMILLFLQDLGRHYDILTLYEEFSEYFIEVFYNFLSFVHNNQNNLKGSSNGISEERQEEFSRNQHLYYERIKEIFKLKVAQLPLNEQVAFVESCGFYNNSGDTGITLAFKGKYQNIPKVFRGMIMYIVEGEEILNDKDYDEISIEINEYQAQVPLSLLVQAKKDNEQYFQRFNGTPAEIVAYSRMSTKGIDSSQAMKEIMHSTNNQIVNDGYLWIREVLQNSLDAANKEGFTSPPNVSINTYLRNKPEVASESDLVVEIADPVGMDFNTVINFLLVPNESSKVDDVEAIGKFGQGFFTIFGDAKEVLIKTSKGNGRVDYIKITPIKDQSGNVLDFNIEMSWKEEDFKGTIIQKIVDTDMPQVEAALCKSATISYGGLIDRNSIQLAFGEKEINSKRTLLAETDIPELGRIRIYYANENAMTQNGLFIKELTEDVLELIPENLRKIMLGNGIVIDIPNSIKLIKSRTDIARKNEIIPVLVQHIPSLALRAYLNSVMIGKAEIGNIPYDYFEKGGSRQVSQAIRDDATSIAKGETLKNYELYLHNQDALTQLLTVIPCINFDGETISVFDLAEKFISNPESIDIDKLPSSIRHKIIRAISQKSQELHDIKRAENEYNTINSTIVIHDTDLPDNRELRTKASVYYAYDSFVRFIFRHIGAQEVQPRYYLKVGQSKAHAFQGSNFIGFNLGYLETLLPELSEIIENKLPLASPKVQGFLTETIRVCTHERQHNLEGSDESQWTHNDTFFDGQREVIGRLIKDKSANFQLMLDRIYSEFTSALIPLKEFINYMN